MQSAAALRQPPCAQGRGFAASAARSYSTICSGFWVANGPPPQAALSEGERTYGAIDKACRFNYCQ